MNTITAVCFLVVYILGLFLGAYIKGRIKHKNWDTDIVAFITIFWPLTPVLGLIYLVASIVACSLEWIEHLGEKHYLKKQGFK